MPFTNNEIYINVYVGKKVLIMVTSSIEGIDWFLPGVENEKITTGNCTVFMIKTEDFKNKGISKGRRTFDYRGNNILNYIGGNSAAEDLIEQQKDKTSFFLPAAIAGFAFIAGAFL